MSRQLTSGVLGRKKKIPIPVDGLFQWLTPESIVDTDGLCRKWTDISGNGYHAEDLFFTLDTEVPDVIENGINGLRSLDFQKIATLHNQSNDALSDLTSLSGLTMIAVKKLNNTATTQCIWGYTAGDSEAKARARIENGRTTNRHSLSGRRLDSDTFVSRRGTTSLQTVNPVIQTGVIDYNNASAYLYINNVFDNNTVAFQTAGLSDSSPSLLIHIGSGASSTTLSQQTRGLISEIIIYTRAITEAERTQIHNYLSNKYNI